jgi:TonB-dependent starch-binding outer membrane protein SusC
MEILCSTWPVIQKLWAEKTFRKMRLTLYALILAVVQSYALSGYAQATKLNLNMENSTVREVLLEIENMSEFRFLYNSKMVNVDRTVSVEFEDLTIDKALDRLFKDTDAAYRIIDRQVVLFSKNEPVPETVDLQQQRTVSGAVTDNSGQPLPGVTVVVKGTTQGTVTNADGNYSLSNIPEDAILVFSFVGMRTQEVEVGTQTSINVTLEADVIGIEEVVAIGYGTMKKSDLTGSVASVRSEDFVKGVASNALQLLSGKASGVSIQQVNSEPGAKLTMRVRGAGSINSSNEVLFVIDGLPGGNPTNINPDDIESIEILKDASAAAIYGTRAANGVVLITTKKGTEGIPQVSYNTYWAYQTPSSKMDVLNATQYMQMINDISKDAGKTIPYTDEQIAKAGEGTDWQEEIFRNSWASNHQLSVSGGNNQSSYYASLGYLDQDGIMISSGFKKYNVLVNLEINPSDKFKFGLNVAGNMNEKDKIANESNVGGWDGADPLNAALWFDPRISPEKNEDGEYETNPSIALDHPIALAYGYDYRTQNNRIYGSSFVEYQIAKGLKTSLRLGSDINNIRNDQYRDQTTLNGKAAGGSGDISSNIQKYWLIEGLLNYERSFEMHNLSVMLGSTWEKFDNLYQRSFASGFLSDVTNTHLLQSGDASTYRVNSSKSVHKLQSLFGRLNYNIDEKYLFTATIRRDGTSRFSEKNKYAFFPSVAIGWRMSEEPFVQNFPALSNLKLRFGYGQMGNEGIGNFETISTFVAGGNTVLGGVEQSGAQPARIPNPDLKWETTEEFNLGIDFGFFENRISGSLEYYIRNTKDQLFSKPVPMSTGFSNIRTNFGTVRNSGIDFLINTDNLKGQLKWNTTFSLSTLKNEVVELPPYVGDIITGGMLANVPGFALVREGYPIQAFYGYKIIGIFQEDDDIANSPQPSAKPGEPIFLDSDKNGKIDSNDRIILGDPFPDISYSFNNSLSYRNFNLDIYILGVHGIHTFNGNVLESMSPINFDRNIMSKHYFDRWTPDNPDAKFPSGVNPAVYYGGGKMINNFTVQDASYLRFKNITLSYYLPLNNSMFKSIQLSLSGENLLTFTKFDGFDPEGNQAGDGTVIQKSSYNNYPLARTYRLGVNINF